MDLLAPRNAYGRAQTEDPELQSEYSTELQSITSKPSSYSLQRDESLLLDHKPDSPIRKDPLSFGFPLGSPGGVQGRWSRRFHGWRTGALTAATLALVSLLINVVVASWLGARDPGSGLVQVYEGSCGKVENLDIWIHLAINILSTLLLGGSNYCMQCLTAPTRSEVDRAHSKGKFLDIGVPSIRNLRSIAISKSLLWLTLGLSSVPLHLMLVLSFTKYFPMF